MGRHFPVREKSGNFEQTGKVRENHTKYWKTEINWDKYYLVFSVIFKWTVQFLVKWIKFSVKKNKTLKKYWKNGKKYWKSQGKVREFCQSGKVGTLSIVRYIVSNVIVIRFSSLFDEWSNVKHRDEGVQLSNTLLVCYNLRSEKFYALTGNQTPVSHILSEHHTTRPSRHLTALVSKCNSRSN